MKAERISLLAPLALELINDDCLAASTFQDTGSSLLMWYPRARSFLTSSDVSPASQLCLTTLYSPWLCSPTLPSKPPLYRWRTFFVHFSPALFSPLWPLLPFVQLSSSHFRISFVPLLYLLLLTLSLSFLILKFNCFCSISFLISLSIFPRPSSVFLLAPAPFVSELSHRFCKPDRQHHLHHWMNGRLSLAALASAMDIFQAFTKLVEAKQTGWSDE